MPEFHPLAELAPRDDVSRAITAPMARTQHPVRLPRPLAPRRRAHPRPLPGDRPPSAAASTWTSPATRSPSAPAPTTTWAARPSTRRPDHPARPLGGGRGLQLGPPRGQSAGLEQPAGRPRLRRQGRRGHRAACWATHGPARLEVPPIAELGPPVGPRAAGPGRHPRLAAGPHVAERRHHPRRRAAWPRPPSRSTSGAAMSWARPSTSPPAGPCRTCSPSPA